jgi:hypothetical protein
VEGPGAVEFAEEEGVETGGIPVDSEMLVALLIKVG